MSGNPQPQPVPPRFWAKVEIGGLNECWFWTGCKNSDGYGNISVNGKMVLATHVALELHGLPRPPKAHALHNCDTPGCVNPSHLRWGCHKDNMQEMAAKKRAGNRKGVANGRAKLSPLAVADIRQSSALLRDLAETHGVSSSTIHRVRKHLNWKEC